MAQNFKQPQPSKQTTDFNTNSLAFQRTTSAPPDDKTMMGQFQASQQIKQRIDANSKPKKMNTNAKLFQIIPSGNEPQSSQPFVPNQQQNQIQQQPQMPVQNNQMPNNQYQQNSMMQSMPHQGPQYNQNYQQQQQYQQFNPNMQPQYQPQQQMNQNANHFNPQNMMAQSQGPAQQQNQNQSQNPNPFQNMNQQNSAVFIPPTSGGLKLKKKSLKMSSNVFSSEISSQQPEQKDEGKAFNDVGNWDIEIPKPEKQLPQKSSVSITAKVNQPSKIEQIQEEPKLEEQEKIENSQQQQIQQEFQQTTSEIITEKKEEPEVKKEEEKKEVIIEEEAIQEKTVEEPKKEESQQNKQETNGEKENQSTQESNTANISPKQEISDQIITTKFALEFLQSNKMPFDAINDELAKSMQQFSDRIFNDIRLPDKRQSQIGNNPYQGGGGQKKPYDKKQPGESTIGRNNSYKENKIDKKQSMLARAARDEQAIQKTKDIENSMKNKYLDQVKDTIDPNTKAIKFQLNLLTPDNFDKVKKDILELSRENRELCDKVVQGIMEKACTEIKYTSTYAKLCQYLINDKSEIKNLDPELSETERKKITFKIYLIENVQKTFEGEREILIKKKPLVEMNEEEKNKYFGQVKKRIILNVKFIGELYLIKVLKFRVIQICAQLMFKKFFEGYYIHKVAAEGSYEESIKLETNQYEDQLEGIIEILNKIGQKFEEEEKKKDKESYNDDANIDNIEKCLKEKFNFYQQKDEIEENFNLTLDGIFRLFQLLKDKEAISVRTGHLFTNLVEKRSKDWADGANKEVKPQTMKQLQEEYYDQLEAEEQSTQRFDDDNYHNNDNRRNRGNKRNYNQQEDVYVKKEKRDVQLQISDKNSRKQYSPKAEKQKKEISEDLKNKYMNTLWTNKNQISEDNIKAMVKRIFTEEEKENVIKEVTDFNKEHSGQVQELIKFILKELPNSGKDTVLERVEFIKQFIAEIWKKEDFILVFNEIMNKSWAEECDFPYLTLGYTELLCPFIKDNTFSFKNLSVILKNDEDEDEENLYYLSNFVKTTCSWLKNKGVDISEHISDIETFFKKADYKETDKIINEIKK